MKQRISDLIDVKTFVTFGILGVYLALLIIGVEIPDAFQSLVTVVVSFYFGTQAQKVYRTLQTADKDGEEGG